MPNIETLVPDIYAMLQKREGTDLVLDEWAKHGANMTNHIHTAISEDTRGVRKPNVLYASEIGKKCARQLFYRLNYPTLSDDTQPWTKFKFLYGSLIEESVLALAKAAGHEVRDEQRQVAYVLPNGWEVRGRIDAIIDGHVVDVKSMAPFSYNKYKKFGFTDATDSFGYREQVDFYRTALAINSRAYILGADKVNGHISLFPVMQYIDGSHMRKELTKLTDVLSSLPERTFSDEPIGAKGNRGLCMECSYCEYKHTCWDNLRGFAYSNGPVWLTKVVEEPKVKEITNGDEEGVSE